MTASSSSKGLLLAGILSESTRTLRRVVLLLHPYRWRVAMSLLCMTIACLGVLAIPLVLNASLGSAISAGKMALSIWTCLWMLGGFLVLAVSVYASSVLLYEVAHELTARLRSQYVDHLLRVPLEYHRNTPAGELIERLTGSVADIEWFIKFSLGSFLGVVLLMAGGTVMLFVVNWKLALLVTCATPFIALSLRFLDQQARELHQKRNAASEGLIGCVYELFAGLEVVKAFTGERHARRKFDDRLGRLLAVQKREAWISSLMEPMIITTAAITFMLVMLYGGNLIAARELAPEALITFLVYLAFVLPNARNLALQMARWRHLGVALERLDGTFALPCETDAPGAVELPSSVRGEIEFREVTYRYTDRELALDRVSFKIAPGEHVGVVGESGTGKTTLFNLLLRFYQPQHGSVRIDGIDTQHVTLASLRATIGFVPQDILLFDDSILENVRHGRPGATDSEVRAACKAAQTAEFIDALPAGYQTIAGARGLKLSGGQRQRLAIARALLKDAPILLLDEATSSLDARTERQLREAIDTAITDRTTIIIAHRLATVVHLPRILFLSGSRILDDGTHEELLDRCAAYRTFVTTQLLQDEPGAPREAATVAV